MYHAHRGGNRFTRHRGRPRSRRGPAAAAASRDARIRRHSRVVRGNRLRRSRGSRAADSRGAGRIVEGIRAGGGGRGAARLRKRRAAGDHDDVLGGRVKLRLRDADLVVVLVVHHVRGAQERVAEDHVGEALRRGLHEQLACLGAVVVRRLEVFEQRANGDVDGDAALATEGETYGRVAGANVARGHVDGFALSG